MSSPQPFDYFEPVIEKTNLIRHLCTGCILNPTTF